MKSKTNHNNVITTPDFEWIYDRPPDNTSAKCHLLTLGGVGILGKWGDGKDYIGWFPLPKRNRKLEKYYALLHAGHVVEYPICTEYLKARAATGITKPHSRSAGQSRYANGTRRRAKSVDPHAQEGIDPK